jgi:hypothetical protein
MPAVNRERCQLPLAGGFVGPVFTLNLLRPLFNFFGRAMGFFLYLTAGRVELRSGLAIQLFHTALDFLGRVFGLMFDLTAGFARFLVGMLLVRGSAAGQADYRNGYEKGSLHNEHLLDGRDRVQVVSLGCPIAPNCGWI